MNNMKKRKIRRVTKGFFIGIGLIVATMFTLVIVFGYLFLFGGPATKTRDIKKYETIFSESGIHTAYLVFPQQIPEDIIETSFYHYYRDTLFTPTVQTFLQCKYNDRTYQQEIDRLENTSKTYGNKKIQLLRDEDKKFGYPAYIAVNNADHTYEYALLTGEKEITYVFTMNTSIDSVKFDKKYLPNDFMTEEGREFGSGYSIYYMSVSSSAIETDYTRDHVKKVKGTHLRRMADDMFCVYYVLDDQSREIITGCSHLKYRSVDDEPIETEFHDLNGMEYKDIKVSDDYQSVTVTYLEEGQKKEKSFHVPGK